MIITGTETTIFGCVVAAIIAVYIRRRNAFGAASKELIFAFSEEIAELQSPNRTKAVRDILVEAFPRHNKAVTIFRHNLSLFSKSRFDKAWQQYHSGHQLDVSAWEIPAKERLFLDYFSFNAESKAAIHALQQIHNLLRFAKQP